MGIQYANDLQLLIGNEIEKFLFFSAVRAARINDHALTCFVIKDVGILPEGIEFKSLDFHRIKKIRSRTGIQDLYESVFTIILKVDHLTVSGSSGFHNCLAHRRVGVNSLNDLVSGGF